MSLLTTLVDHHEFRQLKITRVGSVLEAELHMQHPDGTEHEVVRSTMGTALPAETLLLTLFGQCAIGIDDERRRGEMVEPHASDS